MGGNGFESVVGLSGDASDLLELQVRLAVRRSKGESPAARAADRGGAPTGAPYGGPAMPLTAPDT